MSKKSILIDEKLHTELKIFCARSGINIKDWVEKLISENMRNDDEKSSK